MAMQHLEDTFVGAGGLRLFCQTWRPEGAPRAALVLVHGFGEHSGRYAHLARYLVEREYAVYGFDLRGHGRSPGQRGHIERWAEYREDVRTFLGWVAAREPGRRLFLFGHSMGALIVQEYLLHHPEGLSGAIISGAPNEPLSVAKPLLVATARVLSRILPRFPLEMKLETAALSRDPAVVAAYTADPLVHGKASTRWGTECLATNAWVNAHAADIQLPLLVIHGEGDRLGSVAGARRFFEAVRSTDKRLLVIPGGYHEPHNDVGAEQVFEAIEAHLRPREAPAARSAVRG